MGMTSDSTTPGQFDLRAFALALVQPLCDEPGDASVTVTGSAGEAVCQITVSSSDYTRLSDGRGRAVRSLGTVLGAAAAKQGVRCSLDLRSGQ